MEENSTSPSADTVPDFGVIQSGKYKGTKWVDATEKYLDWNLTNGSEEALAIAKQVIAWRKQNPSHVPPQQKTNGEVNEIDAIIAADRKQQSPATSSPDVAPLQTSAEEVRPRNQQPQSDNSGIEHLVESFVTELQKANGTQFQAIEPINIHGSTRQGMYDAKDALNPPIIFFTFTVGCAILDDSVNGRVRPHPFRKSVEFKHVQSFKQITGSGERDFRIVQLSYYECRSKKEYEWLKGTQFYLRGVIFEKAPSMKTADIDMYQCEIEAGDQLGRLEPTQLLQRAQLLRSSGSQLPITDNLDQLRILMRPIMAKQIMEERKRQVEVRLNSTVADKVAFENAGGIMELI